MSGGVTAYKGGASGGLPDALKWAQWNGANDESWVADTTYLSLATNRDFFRSHVKYLGSDIYLRVWKQVSTNYIVAQTYDMSTPASPSLGALKVIYSATDDIFDVKVVGSGFAIITYASTPTITACTVSSGVISIGSSVATTMTASTFAAAQGNSTDSTIVMVQRAATTIELQYATISGTTVTMGTKHTAQSGLSNSSDRPTYAGVVADGRIAVITYVAGGADIGASLIGFDEAGSTNGTSEVALTKITTGGALDRNYWVGREVPVYINGTTNSTIFFTYYDGNTAGSRMARFKFNVATDNFTIVSATNGGAWGWGVSSGTARTQYGRRLNNELFYMVQYDSGLHAYFQISIGAMIQDADHDIASIMTNPANNLYGYPSGATNRGHSVSLDLKDTLDVGFMAGNFYLHKGGYKGIAL